MRFQVLSALRADIKLIFLCSPGNPTAKVIPLDVVSQIAANGEDFHFHHRYIFDIYVNCWS